MSSIVLIDYIVFMSSIVFIVFLHSNVTKLDKIILVIIFNFKLTLYNRFRNVDIFMIVIFIVVVVVIK